MGHNRSHLEPGAAADVASGALRERGGGEARPRIRRGFADIPGSLQVHYRSAGEGSGRPVLVLHPSPGSSKMMETLVLGYAATRRVVALDTLGNGDSSPPAVAQPDIAYLAQAALAAIDALGIDAFDLHAGHTGGNIAVEIALAAPDRVAHLVLDGMSLFSAAERAEMIVHHAPPLVPAADGSHLIWAWGFVRDGFLFWPWYRRDAEHQRGIGLPAPDVLHDKCVEVLKAARTYHLSYQAALRYDKTARLPLVSVPTLLTCARNDVLLPYLEAVAALLPAAALFVSPGLEGAGGEETLARLTAFLDDREAGA